MLRSKRRTLICLCCILLSSVFITASFASAQWQSLTPPVVESTNLLTSKSELTAEASGLQISATAILTEMIFLPSVLNFGEVIVAEPGAALDMIFLPKFLGFLLFDQAHEGAQEAAAELANPIGLQYLGPTPENSIPGQIDILTTATIEGVDAIMISNNTGDQIAPAAVAARESGMTVVTWDSPIPSAEGEQLFISPVDFDETGKVMADLALSILGEDGGQFAILSASPDAAMQNAWIADLEELLASDPTYANLELLDIVYGNDQSQESYDQALALVENYPNMELIMAPTAVGIVAAAKAMQDEGLCDTIKVSGLGLPHEMASYTLNGCAPEFAFWSFLDLGYLTYYATYLIANGQMEAEEDVTFFAGRMGAYTIEKDPTRDAGLRIVMGFTIYTAENVETATQYPLR